MEQYDRAKKKHDAEANLRRAFESIGFEVAALAYIGEPLDVAAATESVVAAARTIGGDALADFADQAIKSGLACHELSDKANG